MKTPLKLINIDSDIYYINGQEFKLGSNNIRDVLKELIIALGGTVVDMDPEETVEDKLQKFDQLDLTDFGFVEVSEEDGSRYELFFDDEGLSQQISGTDENGSYDSEFCYLLVDNSDGETVYALYVQDGFLTTEPVEDKDQFEKSEILRDIVMRSANETKNTRLFIYDGVLNSQEV